jgi:hypothetical protein
VPSCILPSQKKWLTKWSNVPSIGWKCETDMENYKVDNLKEIAIKKGIILVPQNRLFKGLTLVIKDYYIGFIYSTLMCPKDYFVVN